MSEEGTARPHLLTVIVEDYYHVAPFKKVVRSEQWYRFERRVLDNTHAALELLAEHDVTATFFILGSIAEEMPDLVRTIADSGHEIASKGFHHHSIRHFRPGRFREDLRRSKTALEDASGCRVYGFRIGHRWFGPDDLWALDVLAEEGFVYDSSLRPLFFRFAGSPDLRRPHVHEHDGTAIHEFPLSSWTIGGFSVPISGGNYFRQLPHVLVRNAVARWVKSQDAPFLMYFHVWELDPDQPRIQAVPLVQRVRQYRNLGKMRGLIEYYLQHYSFGSIADHLGLFKGMTRDAVREVTNDESSGVHFDGVRVPVTIVVPCFNEELILPYLANTLRSVRRDLADRYDIRFLFVDDGSHDVTWSSLQMLFGERADCDFVRHETNRGVAAAIMTGIQTAETDIVCSIDCDCTYDPHQLRELIPLMTDGVDMVTASPYHIDGEVRNVPGWRLFLSKSLSQMYRRVLHQSLATYTSCFRVYRRDAMSRIDIREGGFLGVAEMLGVLDLQGGSIVEYPARLEVRLLGRSKMRTLQTIAGHLRLLIDLAFRRLRIESRKRSFARKGKVEVSK